MQAETVPRHELPWPGSLLYDFKQRCLKAVEFGERNIRKAIDRSDPEVAFSIFSLFINKQNDYGRNGQISGLLEESSYWERRLVVTYIPGNEGISAHDAQRKVLINCR